MALDTARKQILQNPSVELGVRSKDRQPLCLHGPTLTIALPQIYDRRNPDGNIPFPISGGTWWTSMPKGVS